MLGRGNFPACHAMAAECRVAVRSSTPLHRARMPPGFDVRPGRTVTMTAMTKLPRRILPTGVILLMLAACDGPVPREDQIEPVMMPEPAPTNDRDECPRSDGAECL